MSSGYIIKGYTFSEFEDTTKQRGSSAFEALQVYQEESKIFCS